MDEDPLQRRIYFLILIESLEMIFYQYKDNFELLLDYPDIGGEFIKYFVKESIRNLLHDNIDVNRRNWIAELPGDGVKCISKLQSHCENMTFSDKIRYDRLSQQVTHKGEESAMNYIKIPQNVLALSVSVRDNYSEDQLMHILLDNFHQVRKYTAIIASHQAGLRSEEKFPDQQYFFYFISTD